MGILFNGNKGAGLYEVITPVLYKILHHRARVRKELHLVQHDQCVALVKLHVIETRKIGKERIEVVS